jgi:hypothetical protein
MQTTWDLLMRFVRFDCYVVSGTLTCARHTQRRCGDGVSKVFETANFVLHLPWAVCSWGRWDFEK